MNDNEKYIEEFVKDIPFADAPSGHRDALKAQLLSAFPARRLQPRDQKISIRKITMSAPITKLAAAAAIIAVLWIGIHLTGHSSIAWAEVVRNIQNARTLVFQTAFVSEDGRRQVLTSMFRQPDHGRVQLADGRTWIMDLDEGRTLVLDSNGMQALLSTTPPQTFDVYDTFRNFRSLPEFSVRRLGRRRVDGVAADGFELTKAGDHQPITVWADRETSLPLRIEQTVQTSDGHFIEITISEIVFDAELDQSLFSLEVPAGYTPVDTLAQSPSKLELRLRTAVRMNEIMRACRAYMQDHQGQWPDRLVDLASYGLAGDALVNPRRPELDVGYVYSKPSATASPQQIVLYEAYESWGDGVNVGCVNGHIEFIEDESVLKDRLQ
jgi:outer membrane lipoprotein-sorting protein